MYKDVFLDLDDTVFDFKKGQHNALFEACGQLGIPVCEKDYIKYDAINKEAWKKYERGETEKSVMLEKRFEDFLFYKNIKEDAARLNALYGEALSKQGCFLPGAEDGIKYLKKKYRLSLITNGNIKSQRGRLHAAGLDDFFDFVFISDEVGYRKPDLEFFTFALKKSGAKTDETVVVGDSPSSDILGANKCGIDAVLFDIKGNTVCPYPYVKKVYNWTELCLYL